MDLDVLVELQKLGEFEWACLNLVLAEIGSDSPPPHRTLAQQAPSSRLRLPLTDSFT